MFALFNNLRLRWKVLIAPAFLILVLVGVGAYALHVQRANKAVVDALMVGPVLQAETAAAFGAALWAAQARLYRLTATAANETDEKKIKSVADQTAAGLSIVEGKLRAFDAVKFEHAKTTENLAKVKLEVATYLKQAKNVTEMADGDPASALMFMTGAERSFAGIEKLSDEMTKTKTDWQVISYGSTLHSFTNPAADGSVMPTALYSEQADRRAWASMRSLFDEVLCSDVGSSQ